ncbi:GTP binding protein [Aureococcus anophagefferens]|nr:GTP binding protein [Aureococcus anophagefferens]
MPTQGFNIKSLMQDGFKLKRVDEAKLSEIPVLCFANKCDLMNAMEEEEIEENVNPVLKGRNFKIQKCSAKTGVGLQDGMEWLVDQLNNGAD